MCFDNTRAALATYDADKARRDADFDAIKSTLDLSFWEADEKIALNKVRAAFHRDIQEVNSLDSCMRVDEPFMRVCAANFEGMTNEAAVRLRDEMMATQDSALLEALALAIAAGLRARALLIESEARKRRLITGSPVMQAGLVARPR